MVSFLAASLLAACGGEEPPPDRFGGGGAGGETVGAGGAGGRATSSGPGTSSTSSGPDASNTSSASGSTATDSTSTGPPPCPDPGDEPNETQSGAASLGSITDCDDTGASVSGVLAGETDVDWYAFSAEDKLGCKVNAHASVEADSAVQLCLFVDCKSGTAGFGCPSGATATESPSGHPGCCSTSSITVEPNCDGAGDDASVYLSLTKQPVFPCVEYKLTYHY